MTELATLGTVIETAEGSVQYVDSGSGSPVLFVHGSPGGCDEGELMGRFLVEAGYRVIAPSRPGYLATPLTDANATPDAQAALHAALLDALGLDQVAVACWSGGGPSSYRLAATHPDRVRALVAIAAVSGSYTFAKSLEGSMLEGRFGRWLIGEMAKHSPKSLVTSTVAEEGHLDKHELKALVDEIWADPAKRQFVLDLAEIVAGRKEGLENDKARFPEIADLGLADVTAPVLLVHGTVDADVPPDHSEHALGELPEARLHPIEGGTHISVWTGPDDEAARVAIVEFLADPLR
jgi:pimeloyl-ACP methyl ester carboxylesterase